MEGWRRSKLSRKSTMEERECQRLGTYWGRTPLKQVPQKSDRYAQNLPRSAQPRSTAQKAVVLLFRYYRATSGLLPGKPSVRGPEVARNWPGSTDRAVLLLFSRYYRNLQNPQKHQNENEHIFIIRTPFLMFLGSLESQRKDLQEYTEKHHSTTRENKTKCRKLKPLYKEQSVNPPT